MENELTLNEYIAIFKRRWHQVLTAFLLLITIITIVIFLLPFVYEAKGEIAIVAPVVSDDVVKTSTKEQYVDESVDKVRQKVLSTENLIALNKKYNLYPGIQEKDKLEQILKQNIFITSNTKDSSANTWTANKVTVGLTVGFKYSDPDITYQVANDIISQLLEANAKTITKQATETTNFLTEELARLKADLEVVENKVAVYKQQNANSLPEHQQMHMATLEQLRTAIKDVDREYKTTQEELRYLDVEYATTSASFADATTDLGTQAELTELEAAKAELDQAMVLYKETHPTIRSLKRKVALLEKAQTEPKKEMPVVKNPVQELTLAKIKTQIETAKARLDSLSEQKNAMNRQIAALQSQILKIPQVERGLVGLQRDYANAKAKYEDVKAKQINAKIAENLALGDRGERFILKRSPEFPKYRESPKRAQLLLMGGVASLVISFALAMLLEMLDSRVRGQAAVTAIVGTKLLAVIPYIETQAELNKRKKLIRLFKNSLILLIGLALAAAIVHFYVTPLNELLISKK